MSKQSSAPNSDLASRAFARSRRSRRRRSKSTRCSQSTAIVPVVLSATASLLFLSSLGESAKFLRRLKHRLLGGYGGIFERRRKWYGNVHGSHPFDGPIQVVECAFRNHGGNLSRDPVAAVAFIDYDCPRSLLRRFHQGLLVERPGRPGINHFSTDADLFQQSCRSQSYLHHAAGGDNGDVVAGAFDIRHSQFDGVFLLGNRTL